MALHDPKRKPNFAEEGLPNNSNRQSYLNRLVVPNRAQPFAPEMKGDGTTVVLLPYPDFEIADYRDRNLVLPDRYSEQFNDFSKWLFYSPDKGVVRFGKNPVSLLFDNPSDSGYIADEEHPIHLIYRSVFQTVSKNVFVETPVGTSVSDEWAVLLNGNKQEQKFDVIKRPDFIYAAYAFICRSGDKPETNFIENGPPLGGGINDLPVIFFMLKSTVKELTSLLNKPLRNDDPNAGLLYPSVTGNKFVHFYDKQKGTCAAMQAANSQTRSASGLGGMRRGPVGAAGTDDKPGFGYGVYISDTHNGKKDGITYTRQEVAAYACNRLRPWSETLLGHTPAQCADIVERYCGLPASVLYHAWKTRPEFYSETLKGMFVAKKTFLPQTPDQKDPRISFRGVNSAIPVQTAVPQLSEAQHSQVKEESSSTGNGSGATGHEVETTKEELSENAVPGVSSPGIGKNVRDVFREMLRSQVDKRNLNTSGAPMPKFPGNGSE